MPTVKPGDIFLLAEPKLRASTHNHYIVVLRLEPRGRVLVSFLSSEAELFDEQKDILIRTTDEEFKATGLKKDTFLINQDYAHMRIPLANLFILQSERTGYVSGEFKKRIESCFGLELE